MYWQVSVRNAGTYSATEYLAVGKLLEDIDKVDRSKDCVG
jgi:hypothetical protein